MEHSTLQRIPSSATLETFVSMLKCLPEDTVCSNVDGMALFIATEMDNRHMEWNKETYISVVRSCAWMGYRKQLKDVLNRYGERRYRGDTRYFKEI